MSHNEMSGDAYTPEEKNELLGIARQAIEDGVAGQEAHYPETDNPRLLEKRGVFVTLHKKGELRGCIGYPLPIKPLIEAVVDNALSAAFEDHRFQPLSAEETGEIDIEISVLTVPQKVDSWRDVVVGRDGIIVSKGHMRGLLLPQVPVEQGWDLEYYISYGCLKAGLPQDEWQRGVEIEIFQGTVFGEEPAD